jgi:hypothetical protein
MTGGKPIVILLHISIIYLRCKCYKSFSRLLRHPWRKERGAILSCPGHHTRLIIHHHQPINDPTAGAQAFLIDYTRR